MAQKVSKAQTDLAKKANRYLMDNIEKKITIKQLSEHFHVSPTHMKNCFRKVYGDSVYSYVRREKMAEAAKLLRTTEKTILEIAGRCGYDNGSKFAKVFRDATGFSPSEYRAEMDTEG